MELSWRDCLAVGRSAGAHQRRDLRAASQAPESTDPGERKAARGSVVIPDLADGPGGIRSLRALKRGPEDAVEGVFGTLICFLQRQPCGSVSVLAQERIGDPLRGRIHLVQGDI